MSAAPPETAPRPTPVAEACPLCRAPLAPEQEWCLRCGAAARTRLAAAPGWKGPIVAVAVIAALALGVIAAALVKLAGDSGPAPAPVTHTLTTAAGATPTTATVPGATVPGTSTPSTSIPGTGTAPTTVPSAPTATGTGTVTGGLTVSTSAKALAPSNAGGNVGTTTAGKGRLKGLATK